MTLIDLIKTMDDNVRVAIWLDHIIVGTVHELLNTGMITTKMMNARVDKVFYSGLYNAIAVEIEM